MFPKSFLEADDNDDEGKTSKPLVCRARKALARQSNPILRVSNLTDILDCYESNMKRQQEQNEAFTKDRAFESNDRLQPSLSEFDLNSQKQE